MDKKFIKETVFKTVGFEFDGEIEFFDFDGIRVEYDGKKAKIGANSKVGFARACFLFAMNFSEEKEEFVVEEKKHFENLGFMLDCSRGAVMKPQKVKEYINILATLGFDYMMLYTEDTYEIEGRPRFGYLRGRYSNEELTEIVAYGEKLGVELIPCIQTLGHMRQYLKWSDSGGPDYTGEKILNIRDTEDVLLCGEEETYKFIEDAIKACRKAYKTKRIHIGMDEAIGVGRGRYLAKHGLCDSYDVMKDHLDKVVEICKKYDFEPIMWCDMFFRFANGGAYYKYDFDFPKGLKESLPDVELVYWDYYSDDIKRYDGMMKKLYELSDNISFAGAIGGSNDFLPRFEGSYNNSLAGIKACIDNNVYRVMVTLWGDNGHEANAFMFTPLLPIYSEYCYKGKNCSEEDIKKASEFLTKMNFEDFKLMSNFSVVKIDPYLVEWRAQNGGGVDYIQSKRLFYSDVLYDMSIRYETADEIISIYEKSLKRMEELLKQDTVHKEKYRYAYTLYKIGILKAELVKNLRKSYKAGNKNYLEKACFDIIPELIDLYENFAEIYKTIWLDTNKPFGLEVLSFRFGGVISRLYDAKETILDYLNGITSKIDELEEEILINEESNAYLVEKLISPSWML